MIDYPSCRGSRMETQECIRRIMGHLKRVHWETRCFNGTWKAICWNGLGCFWDRRGVYVTDSLVLYHIVVGIGFRVLRIEANNMSDTYPFIMTS